MLRILDWLAAPFGSQEDRLLSFGVPDVDYTLDDKGQPGADRSWSGRRQLRALALPVPTAIRDLRSGPAGLRAHAAEGRADVRSNRHRGRHVRPVLGNQRVKGMQLSLAFNDGLSDIVQARRPISEYDTLVKEWLANGGEQIRKEYLEALAAIWLACRCRTVV